METKQDFINSLRRALTGKISADELEEHIRYYEEYITTEGRIKGSEQVVLDMLGDPKLIAMSICAADAAGERSGGAETEHYYNEQRVYGEKNDEPEKDERPFIFKHPKLTIMMILAGILIVVILVLALAFSLLKLLWPVLLVIAVAMLLIRLAVFLRDM